ncbi:3-oxoacyl-ACP synthase III family protein [Vibrio sp. 10N.261.51.F12]|uniref:3-oxoacyl-ACP synthase III family protein n=1 Tax=Vibrio sp. 10N.261.51.F12 TaxID=3229679 RepID=UPI00354D7717
MTTTFLPGQVKLLAAGHAFPDQQLDNDQLLTALEKLSGRRYAKIAARIAPFLGIKQRHFCRSIHDHVSNPNPSNSDLVVEVMHRLMIQSQTSLSDLDYLIGHTTTPDTQLPPSIAWVTEKLKFHGPFMELRQACTGFASALQIAIPRITLLGKPVALVGSETGSVYFDYREEFLDQSQLVNYMQMGDGAGGVILGADDGSQRGIISHCYMGQIGSGMEPGLSLDGGSLSVHTQESVARFHHNATNVRQSGEALFNASIGALQAQGHHIHDFDYIIPHQASGNIDVQLSEALGIEKHKIINDAKIWGNLGSAAIWASFAKLVNSGNLQPGDRVVVLGAEATKYMYGGFIYQH